MSTILIPLSDFSGFTLTSKLEYMRKLRNSCCHLMTRFQEEITEEQQKIWYNTLDDNIVPYVCILEEFGAVFYMCGYGLIRYENSAAYLTAALDESDRGKGLGRKIFTDLIDIAKKRVNKICLEVLETNIPAVNLYNSLGFKQVNQKGSVLFLEKDVNE